MANTSVFSFPFNFTAEVRSLKTLNEIFPTTSRYPRCAAERQTPSWFEPTAHCARVAAAVVRCRLALAGAHLYGALVGAGRCVGCVADSR